MSKILRYLACLFMLIFVGNALAAGYSCPTYKKYTACREGYYISNCGTTWNGQTISSSSLTTGNSCIACPSGYTCTGELVCPKASTVTCSAGYYLPANASSCSACGGNNYYCEGGTFTPSSSAQGRKTVTSGYYSTGGTSTTRTGQTKCEAGYYCSSGVRTACSGSLQYQDTTGATSCKSVSTGYYKSSNTAQAQCDAGYRNIAATSRNECVGSFSKTGSQVNGATPTNCNSVVSWNACTPGTCTYTKKYSGTIVSDCTPTDCTKTPAAVTAKAGYYDNGTTCAACPSGYPNSDAGNDGGITKCYSNSKSRAWTGSQVNGSVPANCAAVTSWNACSNPACSYVAYSNSAGTGDGTIKSGCSTNSANCTKTVAAVTANEGYYDAGTSCSACPSGYPNSDAGNEGGITKCYSNTKSRAWTGSQVNGSVPTNCYSVTAWNACSNPACSYVAYSNSAGTGDGTVKSGCSTNNASCTKTADTTTGKSGYYGYSNGNGAACSSCSSFNSSYPLSDNGATSSNYCYANKTKTGSQVNGSVPTNCAAVTSWNSCTPGTCTYKDYYNATDTTCTPSNCTKTPAAVTANEGYYDAGTSCSACPSGYPNSDAGNDGGITKCYSNTKKRAWTGSQTACALPTGCETKTCNSCSIAACDYVSYSNSTGNGDGTLKSGCSTNNASCQQTVASVTASAGRYVSGTTCPACAAGTYQGTDGSTATSCSACSGRTKYSLAGASACSTVSAGYYTTGCDTSGNKCTNQSACGGNAYYCSGGVRNNVSSGYYSTGGTETTRTGQSQCTGATYCSGGVKNNCPTNYDDETTTAGKTSASQCKISCSGGYRVTSANAACSAITSGNVYIGAHSVAYGSTSPAATSCPASYTISGTTAADHDAKSDCKISCSAGTQVVSADAACTTPDGSWYTGTHTVSAGSTSGTNVKSCVSGYATADTTTKTDHDASTDCKISCSAGTRVVSANAACTTPSGNWYVGAHSVAQGSTSSVNSCLTNYTITGTAATNHDAASDCKISCSGGAYIAAANDTSCEDVGAGYWAAASTVSQGSAGVRNACDAGLTTIGSGAGADEAGDCGRVLNVNGEKIYLRSDKKTTPSLNVSISGKTFYGNMGTSTVGSLKIKSSGTTYSVYDDSMK